MAGLGPKMQVRKDQRVVDMQTHTSVLAADCYCLINIASILVHRDNPWVIKGVAGLERSLQCFAGVCIASSHDAMYARPEKHTMRPPARYFFICCVLAATACTTYKVPLTADTAPILLFNGVGTSPNDVAAIEVL